MASFSCTSTDGFTSTSACRTKSTHCTSRTMFLSKSRWRQHPESVHSLTSLLSVQRFDHQISPFLLAAGSCEEMFVGASVRNAWLLTAIKMVTQLLKTTVHTSFTLFQTLSLHASVGGRKLSLGELTRRLQSCTHSSHQSGLTSQKFAASLLRCRFAHWTGKSPTIKQISWTLPDALF